MTAVADICKYFHFGLHELILSRLFVGSDLIRVWSAYKLQAKLTAQQDELV